MTEAKKSDKSQDEKAEAEKAEAEKAEAEKARQRAIESQKKEIVIFPHDDDDG